LLTHIDKGGHGLT